ncbi:SMI1/KNR4 family protein [Actinacidiphila glaucinigra]|uniref:hypothetical protein n=1 Tax=Actinacidiphila glaucinigra TaxID=235986 RepID=UPI00366FC20E
MTIGAGQGHLTRRTWDFNPRCGARCFFECQQVVVAAAWQTPTGTGIARLYPTARSGTSQEEDAEWAGQQVITADRRVPVDLLVPQHPGPLVVQTTTVVPPKQASGRSRNSPTSHPAVGFGVKSDNDANEFSTAWCRVEDWLREHAPADFAALRRPVSDRELADVTDSFALHHQLMALLSAHNGSEETSDTGYLLPRHTLLSAAQMARHRPVSAAPEARWWVPLAITGTGEYLVVDHRPGPGYGAVLQVDHEVGVAGRKAWPSLLALVTELSGVLESGTPLKMPGCPAYRSVGGQRLEWELVPDPTDPRVRLREAWQRAKQRLLSTAPDAFACLRPPARPQDIRAAETPAPLHAQLRALFLLHDGADAPGGHNIVPGGYRLYSAAELRIAHGRMKDAARAAAPEVGFLALSGEAVVGGSPRPVPDSEQVPTHSSRSGHARPANVSWIPFAVSVTGDELLLCQERGTRYGSVLVWNPEANDHRTRWLDLVELCEDVAR